MGEGPAPDRRTSHYIAARIRTGDLAGRRRKPSARALSRPPDRRPAQASHHYPLRRNELEAMRSFHHLPPTLMDAAMMEVAQRNQVGQISRTTSSPELDVMRIGPADRPITPGKLAMLVSGP